MKTGTAAGWFTVKIKICPIRTGWTGLIRQFGYIAPQGFRKTQHNVQLRFVNVFAFPFIGTDGNEGNAGFVGKLLLCQPAMLS